MMIHIIMAAFKCLPDENSGKHGEDESLEECNQYFNKINKHGKPDRDRNKSNSHILIQCAQDEDQGDQANDQDMSRHHICE